MFVPSCFPSKLQHQDQRLASPFSLLVWNIHKENQQSTFSNTLKDLLREYPSDFLLFQEIKHSKQQHTYAFQNYSYALASNIETTKHLYGVVTAAKVAFEQVQTSISTQKEMGGIATHKSLLITEHLLPNNTPLYLVNLHAINFVSLKSFTLELAKIERHLLQYEGSMIIGGDFNNWSRRRVKVLKDFQRKLGLQQANIEAAHHVKAIFSKPIDHVFYRGVTLLHAEAIDTKKVSDHNPIYAKFSF